MANCNLCNKIVDENTLKTFKCFIDNNDYNLCIKCTKMHIEEKLKKVDLQLLACLTHDNNLFNIIEGVRVNTGLKPRKLFKFNKKNFPLSFIYIYAQQQLNIN